MPNFIFVIARFAFELRQLSYRDAEASSTANRKHLIALLS